VAEWREHQREATGGGEGWERRVGASAKQEVAGLALHGGRQHCTVAAAGEAGKQARGRGKGTQTEFPKISGTQL
jgi:hypothetical protein